MKRVMVSLVLSGILSGCGLKLVKPASIQNQINQAYAAVDNAKTIVCSPDVDTDLETLRNTLNSVVGLLGMSVPAK